jgi:hypothetical protein
MVTVPLVVVASGLKGSKRGRPSGFCEAASSEVFGWAEEVAAVEIEETARAATVHTVARASRIIVCLSRRCRVRGSLLQALL